MKDYVAKNGYKDVASVIRSDMATRQLVGADKAKIFRMPGQARGENPGAWKDIDKALGVPEDGKYADYKPAKGELRATAEQLAKFDAIMHKSGAPAYARNAALEAFHEINNSVFEALNVEKAQALTKLQGEWGVKFPAKALAAESALDKIDGADEFGALLEQYGLADHPAVTRVLANIAELRGEDGAPINKGDPGQTPIVNGKAQMTKAEAQAKISSLEANDDWMKAYLAGDIAKQNEMLALMAAIHEG